MIKKVHNLKHLIRDDLKYWCTERLATISVRKIWWRNKKNSYKW